MAVSPAEEILRTLTYNYTATTGTTSYSQSTGIIDADSIHGSRKDPLSCSCIINGNGTIKSIKGNGHCYLTFNTGSSSSNRFLSINLTVKLSSGLTALNVTYSFINLGANKTYTLTFDVTGFDNIRAHPKLFNMTLVLGQKSYTYDNIFSPIATCSNIFAATGLDLVDDPKTPSAVVYAYNNTNTQTIRNIDETYDIEFFIIDKPSQTYSDNLAVRYADLIKDEWRSSSI